MASNGMEDTLRRFGEQFDWHPAVENSQQLGQFGHFVVAGMGGSHLGAWMIQKFDPGLELVIHRNYGVPNVPETRIRNTLFIASSYSGTTEETLDATKAAFQKGMHIAAISTGGALLDFAREHQLPFITIPDTGLEPRMAVGYSTLAIARLIGNSALESAIRDGGKKVSPSEDQAAGLTMAERLQGKIPMIWSSAKNMALAYIWKIKFNETSKIPAFCNVFPELSHNEFTGFDVVDSTRPLMEKLHVIMLEDAKDHPRIQKRMNISAQMLQERGIAVERVQLKGEHFHKIFSTAIYGDWVSLGLARHYGVPNPETPVIAEFKKRMAQS
jgi:glucose/mannose-6-phosphate isomerase